MHMRSVLLSGLLLLSAISGMAADTYIIDAKATAGGKVFNSLEALRQAIDGGSVFIGANDVIELRNNDATLTDSLELPTGSPITVRSADGKRYTIRSAASASPLSAEMFHVEGNNPSAVFDNVHIADAGHFSTTITSTNLGGIYGTLAVNNSLLEGNGGTAIYLDGVHEGNLVNTIISGYNDSIEAYSAGTIVNITFNENADFYNAWDGVAIVNGTVNVDIAEGKYFRLRDGAVMGTLNKNGQGTQKLGLSVVDTLNINTGTLHFERYYSGDTVNVGKDGVFKLTIDPGNLEEAWRTGEQFRASTSRLTLTGGLVAQAGARMELGGASRMPVIANGAQVTYAIIQSDVALSNIPSSMNIENNLLKAYLKSGMVAEYRADSTITDLYPDDVTTHTGYFLVIDHIANLATLEGVGQYADIYRRGTLSLVERDLLDSIYARGGTSGYDRGFLQTIGGQIVQNSMLAMRHNQANLLGKINRRLTAYQAEELKSNPLNVENSNDVEYYSDWEECKTYGQMWASLDQTWMSQNDQESQAGYRYNTTTLTIGYDRDEDQLIYGGALAYSTGGMRLKSQRATRTDIDNVLAAVYGSWAQDGWYVSGTGVAGYGWNDSRSLYTLPGMTMSSRTGNYATYTLGVNAEFGYMMETELYGTPVRFTPYGGLTYARLHRQGANDMGAYNDTVDLRKRYSAGSWNIWEGALGMRLATPVERENFTLVPSLDLALTRTNGDTSVHGGTVRMVNNPGSGWTVSMMSRNRTSVRAVAGIDMHLQNNVTLGANYECEWRRDYWKNQLNVNMSMSF